ncbi:hypothetical protein SI65_08831 [Aspergillus cristatus]|uniref:Uncharacterized protein n=1 Tax=Aspergillus cristatus TaxID=573508 RepID=A0A1E3B3S8_ASPCR|nr:hypothetical protein SI65_08831 [Aspergillus cristatus]
MPYKLTPDDLMTPIDETPAIRAARNPDPAFLDAILAHYRKKAANLADIPHSEQTASEQLSPDAAVSGPICGIYEFPLTAADLRSSNFARIRSLSWIRSSTNDKPDSAGHKGKLISIRINEGEKELGSNSFYGFEDPPLMPIALGKIENPLPLPYERGLCQEGEHCPYNHDGDLRGTTILRGNSSIIPPVFQTSPVAGARHMSSLKSSECSQTAVIGSALIPLWLSTMGFECMLSCDREAQSP